MNPECYISWPRSDDRQAAVISAARTAESLWGKIDSYCSKVHLLIPEYKTKSLTDVQNRLKEPGAFEKFEAWRDAIIEQMKTGDKIIVAALVPSDVNKFDDAYIRRFKTGEEISVAAFHELVVGIPSI